MQRVLNIRNFPEELMRALKAEAAARGITLREYIILSLNSRPKLDLGGKDADLSSR